MSMLDCVVVDCGPPLESGPDHSVIWLHGLGASGNDFEPIVPYLNLPQDLAVRFVFPHATIRPVTLNGGMAMRAWYDIITIDGPRDDDLEGVLESMAQIEALISVEKARGVAAERIVLAGFSQGGAMAYHVALRHSESLAGIMVLSAYLLHEHLLDQELSASNADTAILQCHGTQDPVVPLALGESSMQALKARGYAVDWRTYPVAHSVDPGEITDIGKWLTERFSGGSS